jgi:hypothetical protein
MREFLYSTPTGGSVRFQVTDTGLEIQWKKHSNSTTWSAPRTVDPDDWLDVTALGADSNSEEVLAAAPATYRTEVERLRGLAARVEAALRKRGSIHRLFFQSERLDLYGPMPCAVAVCVVRRAGHLPTTIQGLGATYVEALERILEVVE